MYSVNLNYYYLPNNVLSIGILVTDGADAIVRGGKIILR